MGRHFLASNQVLHIKFLPFNDVFIPWSLNQTRESTHYTRYYCVKEDCYGCSNVFFFNGKPKPIRMGGAKSPSQ
jgi:hypothetical protein